MLATISERRGSVRQTLTLQCPIGDWCVKVWRRESFTSVVVPDPGEDVGKQGAAVGIRMRTIAPVVLHLVPRAERAVLVGLGVRIFERREHLLVRQEPATVLVGQVLLAVL